MRLFPAQVTLRPWLGAPAMSPFPSNCSSRVPALQETAVSSPSPALWMLPGRSSSAACLGRCTCKGAPGAGRPCASLGQVHAAGLG